ncbi:Protein synthesis factor, GTP-binding [Penicillium digitatum]|uniref:Protein synthesis factor, GTP-binding n=1 Tax=Penicillium digitatum TaxID=36651 RepID=A0A7T6XJV7_PENDI|nr:Protein synthesis factor, GTP-binding [Penicillium digitatum]
MPSMSTSVSSSLEPAPRPMQTKSSQSRHQRLQGLTTQLLWRLQQSSPFHSSTTSNLVVPVLPEAALELGVPSKPARLLPGLEESQGALYEIGVSDDGTFVGLTQDELDESMTNLQAMAASLGCKVEILRRVVSLGRGGSEAAAHPGFGNTSALDEDYSHTEQIRISLAGPSTAGKTSLLGTLTSSALDNGRGKSRLSLLKHRHEITSGITSSVAQELIGYTDERPPTVMNYASGNVAGWDDIHAASNGGRLAFVSDLPGSIRYLKSTLRGLVSWAPHYVILCIPANCGTETPSEQAGTEQSEIADYGTILEEFYLRLKQPANNRRCYLHRLRVTNHSTFSKSACWTATKYRNAVDGSGIGKLHAFLRSLPIPTRPSQRNLHVPKGLPMPSHNSANIFDVDEVFAIPPSKVYSLDSEKGGQENRGMVLCGLVRRGNVSIGDEMPQPPGGSLSCGGPGPPSDCPASFSQSSLPGKDFQARWQRIRVVGTIGIEPIGASDDGRLPRFSRIRKGMILSNFHAPLSCLTGLSPGSSLLALPFHTGFTATFRSTEFSAPNSPPLLLGGNATAYIANIRAAVRVICMALIGTSEQLSSEPPSPLEPELFSFDGDSHSPSEKSNGNPTTNNTVDGAGDVVRRRSSTTDISKVVSGVSSTSITGAASSAEALKENVKITFALVSSVEWVELGSQVLVMPGVSAASVVSQPGATAASTPGSSSVSGAAFMSGLEGVHAVKVGHIYGNLNR